MFIIKLFSKIFTLKNLLLFLLLWSGLFISIRNFVADIALLNILTLIFILVGCLAVLFFDLLKSPHRIWYPISWFLLTSAIYYGFGPLMYYFSTPETINYVDAFYSVNNSDLLYVNNLTCIGISIVILTYLIINRITKIDYDNFIVPSLKNASSHHLYIVSVVFVLIGVPIKLVYELPRALGLWDVIILGGFESLAILSLLALIPLFELRKRENAIFYTFQFYALFIFEILCAFVTLSKLTVMKIGIILILASVLRGAKFIQIIAFGTLLSIFYVYVLSPLVSFGRIAFNVFGIQSATDAATLASDLTSGKATSELADILPNVQGWWSRLNYAPAQLFAINQYDQSSRGNTFELIFWIFVPRIIYQDKPTFSTGGMFNELISGNSNSQSAPGMFAEGYWNAGWGGVIFVSFVMGLCYSIWEFYTRKQLLASNYKFLFIMWIGLFPAIQQDSWFVPGVFATSAIAIVFHWIIRLLFR